MFFLCLGSFCMAMIAGCRPHLFLAVTVIYPIVLPMLSRRGEKKICFLLKQTAVFTAPYLLVAGLLMGYNFARFGSFFEFGVNYNLTLFQSRKGIHINNLLAGMQYYLFRVPALQSRFPFVVFQPLEWDNPYAIANGVSGAGLFWLYPLLWIGFAALFVRGKEKKDREIYRMTRILLASVLVILAVVSNMMGLVNRYILDLSFFISLTAAMLLLLWRPAFVIRHQKAAIRICAALLIFGLISSLMVYFVPTEVSDLRQVNQHLYTDAASLFEFWR